MRVPGIRAGLKERSQSAYAAPAPKPVERAIGHVRPVIAMKLSGFPWAEIRVITRTAEEDYRGDNSYAETNATVGEVSYCVTRSNGILRTI
jgi:hypothetical protein